MKNLRTRETGAVVGIDMGATNLRLALANFRGDLLAESNEKIRPEDGPRKTIGQIKKAIRKILGKGARRGRTGEQRPRALPLRGIAIGVPSPIDPKRGLVSLANNLPGWKNINLATELEKEFRVPVSVENDANLAAIGEHWRGVARGAGTFVFIALGTGIGSGIFVDGKLVRGRTGSAGELFRMNLEWFRWNEPFSTTGYFENYVSGLGIAAEGRKLLGSSTPDAGANLVAERDARFVFESMRRGNRAARSLVEKVFTMLGVGVANLIAVLDPDMIVLGGGLVKGAPSFMLSTVRKVARRIHPDSPPIKLSTLRDKAQTYGAIACALADAQSHAAPGKT